MDSTDQRLIELVEKCSHLYNKSSPDYKDKIKSHNSWCSIAEALNATGMYMYALSVLFIYLVL